MAKPIYDDQESTDKDFFNAHPDLRQMQKEHDDQEIDRMEDDFKSGQDEESPEVDKKKKELGSDELSEAEGVDDHGEEQDAEGESIANLSDEDGSYFYDAEKGQYGRRMSLTYSFNKKRKRNFIIIALLSGTFVGLMGVSILSGPFQLIQLANLLRGFHMTDSENATNSRLGKIAKYVRYRDTPQNTRLNKVEVKLADRFEAKMNEAGIKSRYNADMRGALAGYDIDISKFDDPELKRLMDGSTVAGGDFEGRYREIETHVKSTYGLDVDMDSLDLSSRNISTKANTKYFANKKLLKNFMNKSGYKSLGSLRARLMLKKAGVELHPIKKLDNAIKQKGLDEMRKRMNSEKRERIRNGADSTKITTEPATADDPEGDGTLNDPPGDAVQAAQGSQDLVDVGNSPDPPDVKKGKISAKLGRAAGVTAIASIMCAVKGISDNLDQVNHARVVMPLMRFSGEAMATGMQVMASLTTGQPIDLQQLQILSESLYSKEMGSWFSSTEVQAALGENAPGREGPSEIRIDRDGNVISRFLGAVPGLDQLCGALNSFWGQVLGYTLDFIGGPISAVSGAIVTTVAGPIIIEGIINKLAAEEVDTAVAGYKTGSYSMHGGLHMQNYSMIGSGGGLLNSADVVAWDQAREQDLADYYKEGGFVAKYLNPFDVRTPIGLAFANSVPNDPAENFAILAKSGMSSLASILKPGTLFGSKAKAASIPYDYGVGKYGLSINDLEDPRFEIPQENAKLAVDILNGPNGDGYISRAKTCFGRVIHKDGSVDIGEGNIPIYADIEKGSNNCFDQNEEWKRVRFHIFDDDTAGSVLCYEGDCSADFGVNGESSGDNGDSSGGTFTGNASALDCSGYQKLTSYPAQIVNGKPTNASLVPYDASTISECESLKEQCLSGVSGTIKALCTAFEFDGVYYGNNYTNSAQEKYGFGIGNVALYDPAKWYSERTPGLNSNNLLECSGLTAVAVYRAFGYSQQIGCSGSWGAGTHPDLFREMETNEIAPGDFLTKTFSCNSSGGVGGHIAIAASNVRSDGTVLVYETSQSGTTAHFKIYPMSYFAGNHSRWIGPGA